MTSQGLPPRKEDGGQDMNCIDGKQIMIIFSEQKLHRIIHGAKRLKKHQVVLRPASWRTLNRLLSNDGSVGLYRNTKLQPLICINPSRPSELAGILFDIIN